MLPFNQILLAVFVGGFGLLILILAVIRRPKEGDDRPYTVKQDASGKLTRVHSTSISTRYKLWICELASIVGLLIVVGISLGLQFDYIPKNTPGCLPFVSPYGVIASGVDPSSHAVTPKATYPALTYNEAIIAYKRSPNGLATGYFSWDGISVTILDSSAHQLASGAPTGTSWVFQDLNTAAV